jgi:hypothetical protein
MVVSDLQSNITAFLRSELAEEAASGLSRLKRIPYTDIIWFLDYFAALDGAEREALLDGLARWGAMALLPGQCGPADVQQLERECPAFARWREPRGRMGYKGGTRYTDVKMLSMDPGLREIKNYHEDWIKNSSPLAFQPRADLLPDLSALKPAKAPLLRKLVNAAFAKLFSPEKQKQGGNSWKYLGSLGNTEVTVWVDFGSQFCGQLQSGVSATHPEYKVKIVRLSYERLWDANLGWDYLTEENAPRSIDFLAEQVAYLVKLADRVNGLAN